MNIIKYLLQCMVTVSPLVAMADDPDFAASSHSGKVKVFVLAGQSNMEGKGFPDPLSWQVTQEKYRQRYTHFIQDGNYDAFTRKIRETKRFE